MAIVRAPLFSFSARKSIAQALTFTAWKGIQVVKKWFIPANPDTDPQQRVRGHFLDATQNWERTALTAIDKAAWNTRAARAKTPLSGYNKSVGVAVASMNHNLNYWPVETMAITPGVDSIAGTFGTKKGSTLGDFDVFYGTGPTRMNSHVAGTWDSELQCYVFNITSLVTGVKYYIEARLAVTTTDDSESGTYTATAI